MNGPSIADVDQDREAAGAAGSAALQTEIRRMRAILERNGKDFLPVEPVSAEKLREIEEATGVTFDASVREFFQFSNGSGGEVWGAVEAGGLVPIVFPMLEESYHLWALFAPYDEDTYSEWNDPSVARDGRIQPDCMQHKGWFSLAECNGYATNILYDGDPTDDGKVGQIIACKQDPSEIHYVAESFVEFLRKSNDLLEAHPDELLFPPLDEDAAGEMPAPINLDNLKALLVQRLGEDPKDRQGEPLAEKAKVFGYTDMLSFLFGHQAGMQIALDVAVLDNQIEVVTFLLDRGAAVDQRDEFGQTPLITAASCGHEAMVRLLLDQGADVNARNDEGDSALGKAQEKQHAGIVRMLQEAGAA